MFLGTLTLFNFQLNQQNSLILSLIALFPQNVGIFNHNLLFLPPVLRSQKLHSCYILIATIFLPQVLVPFSLYQITFDFNNNKNRMSTYRAKNFDELKDIVAAMVTAFAVSPTNAILDRSVIEYANGKQTVKQGVKSGLTRLVTTPVSFFTSYKFKWMYFVYLMTYATNNLTDHSNIIPDMPLAIQNLIMTFCVNTTCGILKDKAYIQHFGAVQPKAFPAISLAILFMRDLITVSSAFTFPTIFAQSLQESFGVSERKSLAIAQLASPLLIQVIVTPLHLIGLDIYNREGKSFGDRLKNMRGLYVNALTMRMIRFLPAYGIGGIINRELRRALKS